MAPNRRKKKAHAKASVTCHCNICPDDKDTCETRAGGLCYSSVHNVKNFETNNYELEYEYGCSPPEQSGGFFQCQSSQEYNIICCEGNYCNQDVRPNFIPTSSKPTPTGTQQLDSLSYNEIALFLSMGTCALVFLVVVLVVYLTYRRRETKRKQACLLESGHSSHLAPLNDLFERSSGSGSGLPLLVQRTIAKQIQKIKLVGKGRYGEVWMARWRDDRVAVKEFLTTEEASWFRETEIYQTVLMRHENILGFIAADISGATSMYLITDYHEFGSLHDYLQSRVLNSQMLHRLSYSLMAGLSHLHMEILSKPGKPAIAHRDIKSRNVLIKRNGECAIADFGLAVKYNSELNEIHIAPNTRVGTRRYMAPEVLDDTLNKMKFESFKSADIYSVGLVFWEMARRCVTTIPGTKTSVCEDYALPYYDLVPSDPSFEDMYDVVCTKQMRPQLMERWQDDQVLQVLAKIMVECWHPKPSARLTALRIKKTLYNIQAEGNGQIV